MGKIELYIMRIILILFTLISILYSSCTINITKDFFNTNIVAYYLSAIDVNSGVSNVQLFQYNIHANSTSGGSCYPLENDLILEFSMNIYSPSVGFNSSQELFNGKILISNIVSSIVFNNMDLNYNTTSINGASFSLEEYSGPTDLSSDEYKPIISAILNSGKIPNGLYSFNFKLINKQTGVMIDEVSETVNVNEPEYINLISPGGAISDTLNNTVYSTFPVFSWNSDQCSVCKTEIRVSEFNPSIHSSPVDAINDIPSLPNIIGDDYYSINDNMNSFQYPTSNAKSLETGKLYAWQLKRIYESTLGEQEILSQINIFKIFDTYSSTTNNELDLVKLLIGEQKYNEFFLNGGALVGYNQLSGNITLNGDEISVSQLNQIILEIQSGSLNIQEIIIE